MNPKGLENQKHWIRSQQEQRSNIEFQGLCHPQIMNGNGTVEGLNWSMRTGRWSWCFQRRRNNRGGGWRWPMSKRKGASRDAYSRSTKKPSTKNDEGLFHERRDQKPYERGASMSQYPLPTDGAEVIVLPVVRSTMEDPSTRRWGNPGGTVFVSNAL